MDQPYYLKDIVKPAALFFGRLVAVKVRSLVDAWQLQHRIGVRLFELELTQRPIRCLAHHEMLSSRGNIAETALQRINVEERSTSSGLEGDCGHALRHLGNVRRGCANLGLP